MPMVFFKSTMSSATRSKNDTRSYVSGLPRFSRSVGSASSRLRIASTFARVFAGRRNTIPPSIAMPFTSFHGGGSDTFTFEPRPYTVTSA